MLFLSSDVRGSLNNAQDLYTQWCLLLEGKSEYEKLQSTTTDLRSCIKSIEWDLQDLEETISTITSVCMYVCMLYSTLFILGIAEANPHKFRLNVGEIESRKQFINDTRTVVNVSK